LNIGLIREPSATRALSGPPTILIGRKQLTIVNLVVTKLTRQAHLDLKVLTTDVAVVVLLIVLWYVLRGLTFAGANIFGIPYTLRDYFWLGVVVLFGIVIFDIPEQVAPSIGSAIRKRYKGKRFLDWDEVAKAVGQIVVLVAVWLILASPVKSLADALQPLINPVWVLSYHVLFALAIGYYAVSGALRSKAPRSEQPEALAKVSWNGLDEAVKMSQYLKRLEALKSSGDLDDKTYEKLHEEYESKLRATIELR
jgi:hypothetical protein